MGLTIPFSTGYVQDFLFVPMPTRTSEIEEIVLCASDWVIDTEFFNVSVAPPISFSDLSSLLLSKLPGIGAVKQAPVSNGTVTVDISIVFQETLLLEDFELCFEGVNCSPVSNRMVCSGGECSVEVTVPDILCLPKPRLKVGSRYFTGLAELELV